MTDYDAVPYSYTRKCKTEVHLVGINQWMQDYMTSKDSLINFNINMYI